MEVVMPVFLSHKKEDGTKTLQIEAYLKGKGVTCYVDAFDPELQTTDDITATLMKRIRLCSHLMAVVSEYTKESWWVPFEIGVASDADKRISSYQVTTVQLPDFLRKWPILDSQSDLDRFVELYKKDKVVQYSESKTAYQPISSADQFHRELKMALGQK
jgi:hypothetical protein